MGKKLMGFEGILYYGAAGSTASTQITNAIDITFNIEVEKGKTTTRGDSSVPPIEYERVTLRKASVEFTMPDDVSDTTFQALRTAASTGTPVALRGKDYASGVGPDGDFTLSCSQPWPLNGEQVVTFSATPTNENRALTLLA